VFDALTSKRIYKPSFSIEETMTIIDGESGKHFDPEVVQALHKAMDKVLPIMKTYAPKTDQTEPALLPSW
jgi:putative two-component system response regulator